LKYDETKYTFKKSYYFIKALGINNIVNKYKNTEGIDLLIEQLDYDLKKSEIGSIKNAMYS
jgi:hypothetical protein